MEGVTWALANFAVNLKSEDLDPGLVLNFKKYLLDAIGCGLYGSCLPWSQIVNRFIKEQRGKKEATLWLQKFKGPSTNVSLGLGVMIHSFDFDDYHNAKVHPGAVEILLNNGKRFTTRVDFPIGSPENPSGVRHCDFVSTKEYYKRVVLRENFRMRSQD